MKVLSLFSGGLDSILAVALLKKQGLEVIALNFSSPFFGADEKAFIIAQQLDVPLHTIKLDAQYYDEVILHPKYGFGKNHNPCIDCHGYMLKMAGEYMHIVQASFLSTGEVLGQRPMSQNKSALKAVEKLSTFPGYVLRPLSAQLLEPTIPEEKGWIDRNQLLDISGRSRVRQMKLAQEFGIENYPTPAGGCLLTDGNYSKRLKYLISINEDYDPCALELLKVGRHFHLSEGVFLIVGRNHKENLIIENHASEQDIILKVLDYPGPSSILRGCSIDNVELINLAAGIVARYSDAKNQSWANVKIASGDNSTAKEFQIKVLEPSDVPMPV